MTEKRFKIADYPTDIEDTVTGEKYPCSSYGTHMEIICDLLNALHEENKEYEQLINEMTDVKNKYKEENEQLKSREHELALEINALVDENEQLKQRIKVLEDTIDGLTGTIAHFDLDEMMND